MNDNLEFILLQVIRELLIPEIAKIVAALHAEGRVVTEAAIMSQIEARGLLQKAQVEAWLLAHPPS